MPDVQALLAKIQGLPPDPIAEIENFVELLAAREKDSSLVHAAVIESEPAFAAIWNNLEDDAYNTL